MKQLNTKIVLRNDIYSAWESANPILLKGEVGVEYNPDVPQVSGSLDYKVRIKIGDGVNRWSDLPYFGGDSEVMDEISSAVDSIVKDLGDAETEGTVIYRVGALEEDVAQVKETSAKNEQEIVGLTNSVNGILADLEEKANADDVYTKAEVDDAIIEAVAQADHLKRIIIDNETLARYQADPSLAEKNVIYMVKVNSLIKDSYQEFMRFDSAIGAVSFEQIGDTSVDLADYAKTVEVDAKIAAVNEEIDALPKLFVSKDNISNYAKAVRYEVFSKPEGTLVSVKENEIRIMCPANTDWKLQTSGENAQPNLYYIGLRIYAPSKDIYSFKEDLTEVINDNTMYYFENNDFAGIDADGRKYSVVWLPVASYDEAADSWTYYGASSSADRMIGWYHSAEWYDINGLKVASDCIKINLSNENCHYKATPYYVGDLNRAIGAKASNEDLAAVIASLGEKANQSDVDLLVESVNEKADKATTLAGYEITDAYTKDETYNREEIAELLAEITGGESAADVLLELNNYKKSNDAAVKALDDKLTTIEEGAQVNVIESIHVNDVALPVVNKVVSLPAATIESLGLVKLSEEVGVNENNALEIKAVNVNKLVQDEEDSLILNGGSATK